MKQLTLNAVMELIDGLREEGYSDKEIAAMPIYIGNDDELNGIHTAWYVNLVDSKNADDVPIVEMINANWGNIKLNGNAILIS